MATSEAQKKATIKYMKENLEEIRFRVPKGKKAQYRACAEGHGKSLSAFIVALLDEALSSDLVGK